MPEILGKVEVAGRVLVESISIWVNEPEEDFTGVLTTWNGSFNLPASLSVQDFIYFLNNQRSGCKIAFEDGRPEDIVITNIEGMSPPAMVYFTGANELK